jgi:REP element-mobilizing transposase RayT
LVRKFNKYLVDTTRVRWWDYSWNGRYFVTINTRNRVHYFGSTQRDKLILSEAGEHAHQCWLEIPAHFPFVKLGEFVIMPDHVHGIIIIDKPDGAPRQDKSEPAERYNAFGPQSKNLASIIRGFKVGVTKTIRIKKPDFGWQGLYHCRIIRNERAFQAISRYIKNNPQKWVDQHPNR